MRFNAVLQLHGKTATGFEVPPEIVAGLGGSKRPAVTVTIDGYSYRSTVASMGGRYLLPVSAEHRAGAGISAGDAVEVDLELDTQPRAVAVPADFAAALADSTAAARFFEGLSYSQQLWYVTWIEGAKQADTRARRLVEAIGMLEAGRAR